MDLKELKDKSILLFGKSRAFGGDEFESQLKFHGIKLVAQMNESVALVVDGRMMTPYEQNRSDALYEQKTDALEFVSIDALENELAKHIDADTLLMSLKLSRNKERLKSFIQNPIINDELFFKLLKMYSWGGEDFFENDNNRDVSAAIILRFYKNIERNHNAQYATFGFVHIVSHTDDERLLLAISELEPLQKHLANEANYTVLASILTNPDIPKTVLNQFVSSANVGLKVLIAKREDCSDEMQKKLYDSMDESIHDALSCAKNLSKNLFLKLVSDDKYAKNLAKNLKLDDDSFGILLKKYSPELAKNSSLTWEMQALLLSGNYEVLRNLASNQALDKRAVDLLLSKDEILCELYKNPAVPQEKLEDAYKNSSNHVSLSYNENTPKYLLLALADSSDIEVLKGLAQNQSTPIEVLYQLQLNSKVARAVMENRSFGKYIQRENIGWEV